MLTVDGGSSHPLIINNKCVGHCVKRIHRLWWLNAARHRPLSPFMKKTIKSGEGALTAGTKMG
jgi:hypothetical protein